MSRISLAAVALVGAVAVALAATAAPAAPDTANAVHYYVSLGDSLSVGVQPIGEGGSDVETDDGYPHQLYTQLRADDPKLELVKLGCGGESTRSMRFGSVDPSESLSCGPPDFYRHRYPRKTQLAEAVSFLHAHRQHVSLVTIDIGANDLSRVDDQGNVVLCLLVPAGCATQEASLVQNLTAILSELRAAAGPDIPIVGMSYYDAGAPQCVSDPSLLFTCSRVDAFNAILVGTYAAAGVPVADVAGAFENDNLPNAAAHVCAWTWFCSLGDIHPNATGYAAIAQAFADVLGP